MTDGGVFAVYEKLWARAEAAGVFVHYVGSGTGTPAAGGYHPRDDMPGAGPMIEITRPYYERQSKPTLSRNAGAPANMPPPDILQELMTLAHEYGHHLSYVAGNRTPEYVEAVILVEHYYQGIDVPAPTERQKTLILDEEKRAWSTGREHLVDLGFTLLDAYDAKAAHGLGEYETIFRWETLPWHISAVVVWCENEHKAAQAKLFLTTRDAFYAETDRAGLVPEAVQALYMEKIWPIHLRAIRSVRALARREVERATVIEALDACIEAHTQEAARLTS